jgi:segregation and condensation protein A
MDYKVDLEAFNGPMDLLLYLVRRSEVDIYDIPIATIADQFVTYVEIMEVLDIEYAAAFLVMAATLMDIKARMLVPQLPSEEDAEDEELLDPREELIRELLEYKKVRDAALYLNERFEDRMHRFESGGEAPELEDKPLEEVEVWDLFAAFSGLLKQIGAGTSEIVSEDLPVEAYIERILGRLTENPRLPFVDFFDDTRDRATIVGLFVAILELVRQRRLRAIQEDEFGGITLELRAGED